MAIDLKALQKAYNQILVEHADEINDVSKVNPNPEAREDTSALEEDTKKRYYLWVRPNAAGYKIVDKPAPKYGYSYQDRVWLTKPSVMTFYDPDSGLNVLIRADNLEELNKKWLEMMRNSLDGVPEAEATRIMQMGMWDWVRRKYPYIVVVNNKTILDADEMCAKQQELKQQKKAALKQGLPDLDIDL